MKQRMAALCLSFIIIRHLLPYMNYAIVKNEVNWGHRSTLWRHFQLYACFCEIITVITVAWLYTGEPALQD